MLRLCLLSRKTQAAMLSSKVEFHNQHQEICRQLSSYSFDHIPKLIYALSGKSRLVKMSFRKSVSRYHYLAGRAAVSFIITNAEFWEAILKWWLQIGQCVYSSTVCTENFEILLFHNINFSSNEVNFKVTVIIFSNSHSELMFSLSTKSETKWI